MLPTPGKIAFHPINGQNVRVKTPDAMKPPQCHMPEWRNLPQSSAAQRENHRTSMTPLPETAIPIHLLLRRGECEQTRLDNPLKRRLSALEHSDCKHQRLQEDCSPSLPPAARGSCSDFQPGCSIPGSSLASASLLTSRADTLNLPMQNFSAQTTEDKLSQQVLQLYNQCQLFYSHWQVREGLRESLQHEICQVFPYSLLYLVGSSINGFGSDTSDGDLCLVLKHRMVKQRMEVLSTLQQVIKILHKLPFIGKQHLIRAKVPIVRFVDKQSQVEFDLNVNNIVGIRNTFLLQAYSRGTAMLLLASHMDGDWVRVSAPRIPCDVSVRLANTHILASQGDGGLMEVGRHRCQRASHRGEWERLSRSRCPGRELKCPCFGFYHLWVHPSPMRVG
uniref:poly(A) RNA polymerase GLD2 isoform X2 n=1 Tax=Myxine glutinosa TaxID=7769 RepID=UPI00358EEB04